MNNIKVSIESGKRRGYQEVRTTGSTSYLFQYAIKKERHLYQTYTLKIDETKFDVFEDYAEEEVQTFQTLEKAFEHLITKGADIAKLAAIKNTLPF
ncbi:MULTISPECIES: hypothetical protein [unclassified Pseudomonas]|uniref:hypothetical protein n=1 Tax=unclassified Pseudomonas TaxID=196821 RepID=UPI00384CC512